MSRPLRPLGQLLLRWFVNGSTKCWRAFQLSPGRCMLEINLELSSWKQARSLNSGWRPPIFPPITLIWFPAAFHLVSDCSANVLFLLATTTEIYTCDASNLLYLSINLLRFEYSDTSHVNGWIVLLVLLLIIVSTCLEAYICLRHTHKCWQRNDGELQNSLAKSRQSPIFLSFFYKKKCPFLQKCQNEFDSAPH